MKNNNPQQTIFIFGCFLLLITLGLTGCQAEGGAPLTVNETPDTTGVTQPLESAPTSPVDLPGESPTTQAVPTNAPETSEPDPAAIEAAWQSSPHADTFVLDANGQNNTCARCHAPINWMPSMDTLPDSCFACKFELEDPPPTIAESDWSDIPCNICHKVDKKDNILPEFAWLLIAPLGEYSEVDSPTQLCLKCHASADIPMHTTVQVGGDHPDYECTDCHSAHDTTTSCDAVGCHSDVIEPATPIPGHDTDHQRITCGACHDASGMAVGPDEASGIWTTYLSTTSEAGTEALPFTSHDVVLAAPCDRCHFEGNSWGLSTSVLEP